MKFSEQDVWDLYQQSVKDARKHLSRLKVFCGKEPGFAGLAGWVCEQTIQYCVREELRALGMTPEIREQVSLGGRVKADFSVGKALIEIKGAGLFSLASCETYRERRISAKRLGCSYLFVTWGENHPLYRKTIISAVGVSNFFDLESVGEWRRLIKTLTPYARQKAQ